MNVVLKLSCIIVYALGAASAAGLLPPSWSLWQMVAALLLAAHVLEAIVMFKYVKRYPGALMASVALTLLFGLLHWLPLKRLSERP